ncbi:hypothetical protein DFAR_3990012 [Desulfarculales bacterium]
MRSKPELSSPQLSYHMTGNSRWYTFDRRCGLSLDMEMVVNDNLHSDGLRAKISNFLFSTGTNLDELSQLRFSTG